MSFSTLFELLLLFGAYQLGAYNVRHPGGLAAMARLGWGWLQKSWK
jgi:hypothetical protein